MKEILDYLQEKYRPLAVVVYGSFASGMNDGSSDFDCMIIVPEKMKDHDDSIVAGVRLDCFIFTEAETQAEDPDPFLTIHDGIILKDTDGMALHLQERVLSYIREHSATSAEEKAFLRSWIRKTMNRVEKKDDEGCFRAIAFLAESLQDYYSLRDMFYFGSKKAIRYLSQCDPEGSMCFHRAISERTNEAIRAWAEYVIRA